MRRRGRSLIDRLSRVHPFTPLLLWTPLAMWLLWRSIATHHVSPGGMAAVAMAALVVWTFTEYAVHRFLFHLAPTSPARRRVQFMIHGIHHEDPADPERLLMPPIPAAVGLASFYVLFRAALGPTLIEPFFAWFLLGYLAYDYTHFAIHRRNPRSCLGRYLRRRHMRHHFVTPDASWGVTSPLWDWVMGTMGERRPRTHHGGRSMGSGFRTTSAVRAIAVLVSSCLFLSGVVAFAAEWEKVSDKAGVLIERRAVPGTHFFEVRATVHSSLPPGAIFDTLWNHREYPLFVPHLKRLDLLSDTDDEHLVYEQVAVPLARDRDYTVRLRKQVDAAAQRYAIQFATANDAGPPPDGGHVRVRKIEGSWSIELGADGKGSVLRYDVQTEPGGAIPAFVTNLAQREAVAALVHAVLNRTQTIYGPVIKNPPTR